MNTDVRPIPQVEISPAESRYLNGGVPHIYRFTNGYAASVIQHDGSYGNQSGLWELGVLDAKDRLDYSTPITDDVLGYLTDDEVAAVLVRVAALRVAR